MAKAKTPKKSNTKSGEPEQVTVTYHLSELPTAFHKAGLAGLVMLIESMKARRKFAVSEAEYTITPTTVVVAFTKAMLQKLMNDVYDADIVEVKVKSKWQGATIKREEFVEEEENGKKIKIKRYVYDQVQPKGTFFDNVFDGEKEIWRKLWRDMLWNIPRGRPTTRIPYSERANKKDCGEGTSVWIDLLKVTKALANNSFCTTGISSALLPGAQALNAEGVPFEGRAEQNLLLHFWPLSVLLFVPQLVASDGSTDFVGYSLAVPEVSNLEEFIIDYPNLLNGLSKDVRGYRPAQSVIDIPAEGALALMERLASITGLQIESDEGQFSELRFSISGTEYLHLVKEGNNVKTMSAGRLSPIKGLLANYRQIVAPKDESTRYRNPIFRRGLLAALIGNEPWHRPFVHTLATYDAELFIRQPRRNDGNGEKGPPQFANDAAKKFQHESKLFADSLERSKSMPEAERPKAPLSVIINRVVRNYLLARTTERTGIKLDNFETEEKTDWSKVPGEFNDAKQKLAQSLFLEFRSRKEQAFVDHFAATFFSVTQRFGEADRLALAEVLVSTDHRDGLKTLTLLSLSANS